MDKLQVSAKVDIPFEQAGLIIHNPEIEEIAYIGQKKFFRGCEYLNFSKQQLEEKDKINLQQVSNFEILMTILKENTSMVEQIKDSIQNVLFLLFPDYKVGFLPMSILLSRKQQDGVETHTIDKDNFESFKKIVSEMFCLKYIHGDQPRNKYNPGGPQARALVKKFEERAKTLAKLKNQGKHQEVSLFYTYVSILSVGLKKDRNELMKYTVFQLIDQFRRFNMQDNYDLYIKLKIAGAKDLEQVKNWKGSLEEDAL